jgi:hypothetical protein
MTQDEMIELAREAGWTGIYSQWVSPTEREHLTIPVTMEQIEAFAKLVAEREREICAKLCDKHQFNFRESHDLGCLIRARGQE